MDYPAIAAEIAKPAYAGMTDDQIAATLQAMTVTVSQPVVPVTQIMDYLRENNLWLPIKAAAAAGSSPGAMAAVDYNDDQRNQTLDLSQPIVAAMLADLVAHSLLTADQAAAINAMGTQTVPFAREPRETIDAGAVDHARTGR